MVSHSLGERQKSILSAVIEEYVRSARPVASRELQGREEFDFGPATIRNEMLKLDRWGYLNQPHTSAGRVPTDRGYRFFVDYLIEETDLRAQDMRLLQELFHMDNEDEFLKEFGKRVAHISNTFTTVGRFGDDALYDAGFSEIFDEPEFRDARMLKAFGRFMDEFNESVRGLFEESEEERILIGAENPMREGRECTVVLSTWKNGWGSEGFFAMVGPKRTNYAKHRALLRKIKQISDEYDG